MLIKLLKFYTDITSRIPLKARFVCILLVNSLIIILFVGSISYYNISGVYKNKVQSGIQSSLDSVKKDVQRTYEDLTSTTKQFVFESSTLSNAEIAQSLESCIRYFDTDGIATDTQTIDFANGINTLRDSITLVTSLNQEIGTCVFYRRLSSGKDEILFSNDLPIGQTADAQSIPALQSSDNLIVNAVHKPLGEGGAPVVSVQRKIPLPDLPDDVYIYVETGTNWYGSVIGSNGFNMRDFYVMTDKDNKVIFSENTKLFAGGSALAAPAAGQQLHKVRGYYDFYSAESGDWHIHEFIAQSDYNHEVLKWLYQFLLVIVLCLAVTLLLTTFIWRTVYRPIKALRREFSLLSENISATTIRRTRVREFDELLVEFYRARLNVNRLIKQIEQKEKKQKELEIEKLLIQINPHFVYNTLNSIQWMARLNGQEDIEKMVRLFTSILHYNLGKKNLIVTVTEEIGVLNDYIELQRIRYGLNLNITVELDETLGQVRIPRFILQPLVENAIFHGMNYEKVSQISVSILSAGEGLFRIQVRDNGEGMSPEKIRELLTKGNDWNRRTGLGIGLKYVSNMVKFYYGAQYDIKIESTQGEGTQFTMELPTELDESRL